MRQRTPTKAAIPRTQAAITSHPFTCTPPMIELNIYYPYIRKMTPEGKRKIIIR